MPAGTVQNPATATYDDVASPGGTATASYDPASSTGEDVTVGLPGTPSSPPSPSPPTTTPPPPPTPVPVADLSVRIDGPAIAARDDVVPLVVTATNGGPRRFARNHAVDHATPGVVVSGPIVLDGAPANASCTAVGTLIRCILGLVPTRGVVVARLNVQLGPPTAGAWIVQASVAGDATDPVPSNNAASHTIKPRVKPKPKPPAAGHGRAKLVLAKAALTPRVRPGDPARFRITVRNTGTAAARGVVVCDVPPRTTTLVSAPGASLNHGRACWRLARLGAGHSTRLDLVLRVDTAARPGVVRNVAIIQGTARVAAQFVVFGKPRPGQGGGVTG